MKKIENKTFCGFLVSTKSLTDKMNEGHKIAEQRKKQVKQDIIKNDIEFNCNTSSFFLYLSVVYANDLVIEYKNLYAERERNTIKGKKLSDLLECAANILTSMYRKFTSPCDNVSLDKVGKVLNGCVEDTMPYIAKMMDDVYFAIVERYTKGKKNNKADMKAKFASLVETTRRIVQMAKSSYGQAFVYANSFPFMYDLFSPDDLEKALGLIDEAHEIVIHPAHDIDLSLNAECTDSQSKIIKKIVDRRYYDGLKIRVNG